MLGNLSLLDNSFFLSMRWVVFLALLATFPAHAQTALRSKNFIWYSGNANLQVAEKGLERLEQLRTAIIAIHGNDWAASSPLRVWIPRNEAEWLKIASRNTEQGLFLSGEREDWITANPEAPRFLEVLSHEYIHAVLHQALPNLPTWFEEGICEYYSTLTLRNKSKSTEVILGRAPANRFYAREWAAAYLLWPGYQPGQPLPDPPPNVAGPFPLRIQPIDYRAPSREISALSPTEIKELEIAFLTRVPSARPPATDVTSTEQLFLDGLKLSDEGKPNEAIPLLERACRERPSNSSWWYALALALKEANRTDDAKAAIAKALSTATNETERNAALAFKP